MIEDVVTTGATLVERFRAVVLAHPNKPFVILADEPDAPLTFGATWERACRYAAVFAVRDVRPQQVVALMLPTHREIAPAFFGALMIGAIPAFFPPLSPKQDAMIFWSTHQALFARIDVALIVADRYNLKLIAKHLPDWDDRGFSINRPLPMATRFEPVACAPYDVALLQHSSGTTGLKKGVALTHQMVIKHVDALAATLAIAEQDVIASWLPLYHDMGLITGFVMPALLGLSVVMLDPFNWLRRPTSLFEMIEQYRATLCWLPNFALHHLVRTTPQAMPIDLSSLRAVIDCSEPCKAASLDVFFTRFADHGLRDTALQVCYAMAETVFMVTQTRLDQPPRRLAVSAKRMDYDGIIQPPMQGESPRILLSCGEPMQGVQIRILDVDGSPCADRMIGEIVVASPTLFNGYHRCATPPGKLEAGWYRTGDRGFLDNNALFVTGRTDDLMIINGKNIYAHDIEYCINGFCPVKPGRTVALAPFNPLTGSQALVVITESDYQEAEQAKHLVHAIKEAVQAAFGVTMYEVLLVPPGVLIKTTSGKISRAENLNRYIAGRPALQGRASG